MGSPIPHRNGSGNGTSDSCCSRCCPRCRPGSGDGDNRIQATALSTSAARSWKTRSAIRSRGVGSRLMITTRAPLRCAATGSPAAGCTTSELPTTRNRSQAWASVMAFWSTSAGRRSPKKTTSGFKVPLQAVHAGGSRVARS